MIPKHPLFDHARRGYHHGRLKDALIEAARSLIAQRGPNGFTLSEAAKLVGVTAAAPYRHFADRDELIGALARRGFELFGDRLAKAWDEGRPEARVALRRMGRAYLAFATAEPGLYAAMFQNARSFCGPATDAIASQALEGLVNAAGAVLSKHGTAPGDARRLAFELWALSHGTAMLTLAGHLGRSEDPVSILEHGAEALIDKALLRERR
ncbi:MAG: TetR/AcrR family transcriptional regulator [Beijerinckiaceae bacterium]